MSRKKLRKTTLTAMTAALAATLLTGIPYPAAAESIPNGSTLSAEIHNLPGTAVNVYFQDLPIALSLQPRLIKGTIMVPGKSMLEGLGYKIEWRAKERKLIAVQDNKPTFIFQENLAQAEIGGTLLRGLPVAPFLDQQTFWIPLRLVAAASGLRVEWNAQHHYASVSDPQALPRLSVMTKADNGIIEQTDRLFNDLKQAMKMNVDFVQVGPEYYREKTMVMIAAGDPTSLMLLDDPYIFQDELIASFSSDLTSQLEAFPRLKALAQNGAGSRVINGKILGVPRPGDPHNAAFPAIRKDWLDKLGLAQPQTMEELFLTLKKFTELDPDGNGKHDTVGLTGYLDGTGLGTLSWIEHAYTGSPDRFSVKSGSVVDHAVSDEETLALQWLVRAYNEGLIDKEFAVKSGEQSNEQLRGNKAGLASMSINEAASLTGKDAIWLPLKSIRASSASSPIAPWTTQGNGTYIVAKTSKLDTKQILAWLDYGLEKTENGGWEAIEGWQQSDQEAVNSLFGQTDMLKNNSRLDKLSDGIRDEYESAVTEWRKTSYSAITLPEAGSLWSSGKNTELNNKLEQFKLKVIMGAASIEEWKVFIKEYTASTEYKAMLADLNKLASKRTN
ncbi:extracellular solute-binding protein [Paenibacillus sp. LHD-38]|uniref:extracellular solute-binding protein n=1 Tax=Paenibacillus sp. LHD-38 TaxID=3072143 RepID=UPI00280FC15C|nr:stalk domain-containing protein [Paenibacillus sp. LHD-38]MDQ8733065.1 stalk domain-containing protein [Paenibacillus sp. LHD-38]